MAGRWSRTVAFTPKATGPVHIPVHRPRPPAPPTRPAHPPRPPAPPKTPPSRRRPRRRHDPTRNPRTMLGVIPYVPIPITLTANRGSRAFWLLVVSCSCCSCCASPLLVTQKGGERPCPFFGWNHHRSWVAEIPTESGCPSVALLISAAPRRMSFSPLSARPQTARNRTRNRRRDTAVGVGRRACQRRRRRRARRTAAAGGAGGAKSGPARDPHTQRRAARRGARRVSSCARVETNERGGGGARRRTDGPAPPATKRQGSSRARTAAAPALLLVGFVSLRCASKEHRTQPRT